MQYNLVQTNIQDKRKSQHTYDHVHNIFDSIAKRIFHYVLNYQIYTWGYAAMNMSNCPPKMLEALQRQIKTKKGYKYLLKKFTTDIKRPLKLSDQKMNTIYQKFYSNPENQDQINEETKKLVQILHDHFPIIIQIAQMCFFGKDSLREELVKQLNDQFSNFQVGKKFCRQLPKNITWTIQKLMKPYEKKISKRQFDLRNPQLRKLWLQNNKIYQLMKFKPSGYEKGIILMCDSMHNKTEDQKINCILLFRNLFEQYVGPFFKLPKGRKFQSDGRYIPKRITTEDQNKKETKLKNSVEQKSSTGSMSVKAIESVTMPSRSEMVPEIISQIPSDQGNEDGEVNTMQKPKKTKLIKKEEKQSRKNQDLKCQQYLKSLIKQGQTLTTNKPILKNRYSYLNYDEAIQSNSMDQENLNHSDKFFDIQNPIMEDEIFHREGKSLRSNNFMQYKY